MLTEEGKGQTNWELSARGAGEASKMSTWSGNDLSIVPNFVSVN